MLNTTPEYQSAHQGELDASAQTAAVTEALAHRREMRKQKAAQFVAALSRIARLKKGQTGDRYLTQHR